MQRYFQANAPYEKWGTNIIEFSCVEGKLYLSPIQDLFNGKIIAYNLSNTPILSKPLSQAVKKITEKCQIDITFRSILAVLSAGLAGYIETKWHCISISRKGNCLDNVAMESFFGLLKTECYFGKGVEL